MGSSPSVLLYRHARKGDVEAISECLRKEGDINYRNGRSQNTPLIAAAKYGHTEAVKFLLCSGAADLRTTVREGES